MMKNLIFVFTILLASSSCDSDNSLELPKKDAHQNLEGNEQAFPNKKGDPKNGYYYGMPITYYEIEGKLVFEGDILISKEQIRNSVDDLILKNNKDKGVQQKIKVVGLTGNRWPNNTVFYTIDKNLPDKYRAEDAILHWEEKTNIKFVKRTTQKNYINFKHGIGCASFLGMIGGKQDISLGVGCTTGIAIHEIGHALGLFHEQSRVDRDDYLNIHWENILEGRGANFKTYLELGKDGKEYTNDLDFESIMLYGSLAFSKNGKPTLTKKDGSRYKSQREELSIEDIKGINAMYPSTTDGETYKNNIWHLVHGLYVYRHNDSWWYIRGNKWVNIEYRDGGWHFLS